MTNLYNIPVFLRHLIILILSVAFQLLMFNYIDISSYVTISFYLLFVIVLPVKIKRILLLFLSFAYGMLLDFLSGTPAVYTMTLTFVGFIRPAILRLFFVRDERFRKTLPISSDMGSWRFLLYSFIVIFLATIFFDLVELFAVEAVIVSIYRSLISSVVTLPIIFFVQSILLSHKSLR